MKGVQRAPDEDEEIFKYKLRKQELRIDDLKRFGIQTILLQEYSDIPKILSEIESRFRKKTVFFSGSAEEYGEWDRHEANNFIHDLASECVKANLRVVNGFGWGVGSSVINGALEAIYGNPQKYSEDQLIVRPFPQHGKNLPELWEEYRQRMISLAGVAIFLFGNKLVDGNIAEANGVIREFEIAAQRNLVPIPIGITGYATKKIWETVLANPKKYYTGNEWIILLIQELGEAQSSQVLVSRIIKIIRQLNK
jgi:hypothetical protein